MTIQQLKQFAERVCVILNRKADASEFRIQDIEHEAEEAGLAIATDKTRSKGGRPEFGIPRIDEGMVCGACGATRTCDVCRDNKRVDMNTANYSVWVTDLETGTDHQLHYKVTENFAMSEAAKMLRRGESAWVVCPNGSKVVPDIRKKEIKQGQVLTARSMSDYDAIYEVKVIERKGNWVTVYDHKRTKRRIKVRTFKDGDEYLKPDNYSMAPIFAAPGAVQSL